MSVATAPEDASLILDIRGHIRFCSAPVGQLFGCDVSHLMGVSINMLIPGIPLRTQTPGYNLAYVSFCASDGEWRACRGLHATGEHVLLETLVDSTTMERESGFVVALRRPLVFAAEPMPSPRPISAVPCRAEPV